MTVKLATYWLLLTLGGNAALAQTPPKQKPVRKPAVVLPSAIKPSHIESDSRHFPPLVDEYAQTVEAPECSKVYFYVEYMPTLNGQSAAMASSAAITQHLLLPSNAPAGRVFIKFDVTCAGRVAHPKIVKGLRADVDSAVVAAARQLPLFIPGKQNGRVVTVSLTLPVTIP